jgi:hypothetical protein
MNRNNIFLLAIDNFFIRYDQEKEIEENNLRINDNDFHKKLDLSFLNTNENNRIMEYIKNLNDDKVDNKDNYKEKEDEKENEKVNESQIFLDKFDLKRKFKLIKNDKLIKIFDFLNNEIKTKFYGIINQIRNFNFDKYKYMIEDLYFYSNSISNSNSNKDHYDNNYTNEKFNTNFNEIDKIKLIDVIKTDYNDTYSKSNKEKDNLLNNIINQDFKSFKEKSYFEISCLIQSEAKAQEKITINDFYFNSMKKINSENNSIYNIIDIEKLRINKNFNNAFRNCLSCLKIC